MSNLEEKESKLQIVESPEYTEIKEEEPGTSGMSGDRPQKRAGRRPGRRSSKMDVRAKLERSRQSARECRARKKLRYQYLEDLVANREKAVFALRDELEMYKQWCIQIDSGLMPMMSLLSIGDSSVKEPVERKKQRFDKTTENGDITTSMTSLNGNATMVTVGSSNMSREPETSINSSKWSNSATPMVSKGSNLFKPSTASIHIGSNITTADDENESSMDDLTWTLDGDIISIVPKTVKKLVIKQNNFVLPTITEESEH